MKEKWTPGPWEYRADEDRRYVGVGPYCIMEEVFATTEDTNRGAKEREANARLIAAAPGTYTAAKNFADEAEAVIAGELGQEWADHYGPLFERLCELRDALANARGETITEPVRAETCDPADDADLRAPYEIQEERCPPRE